MAPPCSHSIALFLCWMLGLGEGGGMGGRGCSQSLWNCRLFSLKEMHLHVKVRNLLEMHQRNPRPLRLGESPSSPTFPVARAQLLPPGLPCQGRPWMGLWAGPGSICLHPSLDVCVEWTTGLPTAEQAAGATHLSQHHACCLSQHSLDGGLCWNPRMKPWGHRTSPGQACWCHYQNALLLPVQGVAATPPSPWNRPAGCVDEACGSLHQAPCLGVSWTCGLRELASWLLLSSLACWAHCCRPSVDSHPESAPGTWGPLGWRNSVSPLVVWAARWMPSPAQWPHPDLPGAASGVSTGLGTAQSFSSPVF